jgi:hypothetical protein
VAHYVILSPLESPSAYAIFALHWFSSLICVFVSVHFFRQQRGNWWLLVALAFALPLVGYTIRGLAHGLPPLPYAIESSYSREQLPTPPAPRTDGPNMAHLTGSGYTISSRNSTSILDTVSPIMAIALIWAYLSSIPKIP